MKIQIVTRDQAGFAMTAEFEAKSWAFEDGVVNLYSEDSLIATYARETVLLVKRAD